MEEELCKISLESSLAVKLVVRREITIWVVCCIRNVDARSTRLMLPHIHRQTELIIMWRFEHPSTASPFSSQFLTSLDKR